jgi:hypothetical protein
MSKAKRKPKLTGPGRRLSEKLMLEVRKQVTEMIEAVIYETQDVWELVDNIVQEEYERDGRAWLEVDADDGAAVLCSIGTGDAVFRLPLDIAIDIDSAAAPQDDNRQRLMLLDVLIGNLQGVRAKLVEAIGA